MNYYKCLRLAVASFVAALVAGCVGTTKVEPSHPQLSATAESAKVYFIRAKSGFGGVMDMPLSISLDGKNLLALSKGQYTLLSLTSGTHEMKVRGYTVAGNSAMTPVSIKVPVTFSKGETQYLVFDSVARGYFTPFMLSKEQAVEAVQKLTPIGMAVKEPITER